MYRRSSSKAVSDGAGAGATGVGVGVLDVGAAPPHAQSKATVAIDTIRPVLLRRIKRPLHWPKLLIANVHDRAIRILVNDIKPATRSRVIEKVVMRVI